MKKVIKIGNKEVGPGKPVFIIAEAGVNHNGRLELALRLVDAAAEAGADAVKFQTFAAEDVATGDLGLAAYAEKNIGESQRMVDMLKALELSHDDFRAIKEHCGKQGIMFLSTPADSASADFLDGLVPAFKIASGDITNFPLLEYVARTGKLIVLSTGMATLEEVSEALTVIRAQGNRRVILLHCTTQYPTEPRDANLRVIQTLLDEFGLLVGYSDHTLGIDAARLASELGVVVIEKHFTLDKTSKGPDHAASLEPDEFTAMVAAIRGNHYTLSCERDLFLGSAEKKPTTEEREVAKVVRKSIVAKKDIAEGEIFTESMLAIKRPGTGLSPKLYKSIIGRCAQRDIRADSALSEQDIAP